MGDETDNVIELSARRGDNRFAHPPGVRSEPGDGAAPGESPAKPGAPEPFGLDAVVASGEASGDVNAARTAPVDVRRPPSPRSPARALGGDSDVPSVDPLENLFTVREAARVFGIGESRLRSWSRSGFLSPTGRAGHRRYYTFRDLIGLRVAKELLDNGLSVRLVRQSLASLERSLPAVTRPLAQLRVVADGDRVVVRGIDGAFEPRTGQLVMDFEVSGLEDDVVRILTPRTRTAENRQRAYELYLEGCRLDEDGDVNADAERNYRRALELDPTLSNALTNLGNIRFRQGALRDAEDLYRQALEADPGQPEAHYNLGFLAYERGESLEAVSRFQHAIDEDPSFADAHFNLAMALEELDRSAEAEAHWRTYLELDPTGPWAEVARRYLPTPS